MSGRESGPVFMKFRKRYAGTSDASSRHIAWRSTAERESDLHDTDVDETTGVPVRIVTGGKP